MVNGRFSIVFCRRFNPKAERVAPAAFGTPVTASVGDGARRLVGLLISLAVFVFILWRQRQVRPLRSRVTGAVLLAVLGVGNLTGSAQTQPLSGAQVAWLVSLLTVDAVGLGAVRALTVRIWLDDAGQAWRQGTWWTALLWVAGAAAHEFADGAAGIGSASALLYLGLTLAAQRLVLSARKSAAPS